MAKCPKCGMQVNKPGKTWKMAGRMDRSGKRLSLEIGLYECPRCHKKFRNVLSKPKMFASPLGPPDSPPPFHDSPYGSPQKRKDEEEDSDEEDS